MSRDTEEANAFIFYTLVGIILLVVALLLLAVTGVSPAESSCDDPTGTPRQGTPRPQPPGSRTPRPEPRPTGERPGCAHSETPAPSPDPTATLDPTTESTQTPFELPTVAPSNTPRPNIWSPCGTRPDGTVIICSSGGG